MAFVHSLSLHKFLWVRTLLFITSWGPRVFYKAESSEGSRRGGRQVFVGLGVLCFCWRLIWFFSWCRLFERIWAGVKRDLVSFSSPFSLLCLTQNWKALSWSVVRPENKSKWHVTRTQCSDGPAKVSGPICCGRFLLCRLSAASGERGQGARGCAEMVAAARRSSWHGWEGTAGLTLAAAHSRPSLCTSAGYPSLIRFPMPHHFPMVYTHSAQDKSVSM